MLQDASRNKTVVSAGRAAGYRGGSLSLAVEETWLNRTKFQLWMKDRFGTRPHYLTIQAAIRRGMPVEPHPLLPGRILFPVQRIEAWLEEQRMQAVMPAPLRASVSR